MSENTRNRATPNAIAGASNQEGGYTAAQLAIFYKTALEDFVGGKTSRASTAEISQLLKGALAARKQQIAEEENLSSQKTGRYFS